MQLYEPIESLHFCLIVLSVLQHVLVVAKQFHVLGAQSVSCEGKGFLRLLRIGTVDAAHSVGRFAHQIIHTASKQSIGLRWMLLLFGRARNADNRFVLGYEKTLRSW